MIQRRDIANDDSPFEDVDDGEMPGEEAIEGLRAVARMARLIPAIGWFGAVGQPLEPSEIADAESYIEGLGFLGAHVAGIESWPAAAAAAQDPDWSPEWWEAEEQARAALLEAAQGLYPEHDLMVALTHVSTKAGEVAHGKAAIAAARAGIADEALIRAAAGAAAQAAYQAALVLAADGDAEHPFAVKFRLFEAGRWPLGLVGNTFNLF